MAAMDKKRPIENRPAGNDPALQMFGIYLLLDCYLEGVTTAYYVVEGDGGLLRGALRGRDHRPVRGASCLHDIQNGSRQAGHRLVIVIGGGARLQQRHVQLVV